MNTKLLILLTVFLMIGCALNSDTYTDVANKDFTMMTDNLNKNEADIIDSAQNPYMKLALYEALQGILNGDGGPFGTVIVKDGKVIGKGHNMVLKNNDSTAHGEISAIRNAESNIGSFDLSGAILYTTGEPCPMCLAACMWANISKVYYGCTISDNERIGFRDKVFDEKFGGREKFKDYLIEVDRDACLKLFDEYNRINHKLY